MKLKPREALKLPLAHRYLTITICIKTNLTSLCLYQPWKTSLITLVIDLQWNKEQCSYVKAKETILSFPLWAGGQYPFPFPSLSPTSVAWISVHDEMVLTHFWYSFTWCFIWMQSCSLSQHGTTPMNSRHRSVVYLITVHKNGS